MITKAIDRAFSKALHKKWDRLYWLIDIHDTILKPNYEYENLPKEFYPEAKESLQLLSNRPDIVLILFTCSWPEQIKDYDEFFKSHNIHFSYWNQNPEVETIEGRYGYYIDKPYADVLLDDKAGFDWERDWPAIREALDQYPILNGSNG